MRSAAFVFSVRNAPDSGRALPKMELIAGDGDNVRQQDYCHPWPAAMLVDVRSVTSVEEPGELRRPRVTDTGVS